MKCLLRACGVREKWIVFVNLNNNIIYISRRKEKITKKGKEEQVEEEQ